MARSDKKNRECISCRKAFSTPQKLRQHYKSNKNQCSLPLENNTQRNVPRPRSPSPAPIDHIRGRDRRKEKPKVVNPIPDPQLVIQTPVPETESQRGAPVLGRAYITEEEAKNWVNPNARKPRERVRSWVEIAKTLERTRFRRS